MVMAVDVWRTSMGWAATSVTDRSVKCDSPAEVVVGAVLWFEHDCVEKNFLAGPPVHLEIAQLNWSTTGHLKAAGPSRVTPLQPYQDSVFKTSIPLWPPLILPSSSQDTNRISPSSEPLEATATCKDLCPTLVNNLTPSSLLNYLRDSSHFANFDTEAPSSLARFVPSHLILYMRWIPDKRCPANDRIPQLGSYTLGRACPRSGGHRPSPGRTRCSLYGDTKYRART